MSDAYGDGAPQLQSDQKQSDPPACGSPMMADATASERAYQRVKSDILSGLIPAGPIDIRTLGDRLRMSVTPVREALVRLSAEKLVRLTPHYGYVVSTPGARRLEHLYELSGALLHISLERQTRVRRARENQPRSVSLSGVYPDDLTALFSAVLSTQTNLALTETVMALNDQLHRARRCEPKIFADASQDVAKMAGLWECGNLGDLRLRLRDHHRARLVKVDAIARLVSEEAST